MENIHCGQSERFERVKKKLEQKVKSFEERLTSILETINVKITYKTLIIMREVEKHRDYVREKLEECVKNISSDLVYLKQYGFIGIHNDPYEFEYRLDKIERIVSLPGYYGIYYSLYGFIRTYASSESENQAFVDFFKKLYEFRKEGTAITSEIESIREKIKIIRPKLFDLQFNIPDIGENDYKEDWKLMKKIESLKQVDGYGSMVTSLHREILGIIRDFEKIKDKIKPLRDLMDPIKTHLSDRILSDIQNAVDAPAILKAGIKKIDALERELRWATRRLENAIRIHGYLTAIDPKNFSFEDPGSVALEKIDDFIPVISKNITTLKKMEDFIKAYFKNLRKKYVLKFVSDEIRNELEWFEKYILSKTNELKEQLQNYIETLQSIQSIHKELKGIEKITEEQDKAIKEAMSSCGLDTTSLEKIQKAIERFAEIRKNIDNIEKCFCEKKKELDHIKDNVHQLNSLKLDLLKLQFSIYNDIGFAKTIEKIKGKLKSLQPEIEKLDKVGFLVGFLIKNIESIIRTVGSICRISELICCKKWELSDLRKLKPTIDDLRLYLERLSECINDTNGYLDVLKYRVSVLPKYLETLCKIKLEIKLLESETSYLSILETLPDVLFMTLKLDFMIKFHKFFEEINKYIKCALGTIEKCRLFIGITKFNTEFAGIWASCLVKQIKTSSKDIDQNIQKVESSIESVIVCLVK